MTLWSKAGIGSMVPIKLEKTKIQSRKSLHIFKEHISGFLKQFY